MRLLERDSHLSSLREYAEEARQGQGRLVLVAGEAGVGKSALLDRFEDELVDATWAWGACDGLFTPRPLAPLIDVAGQLGGTLAALAQADAGREQLFSALVARLSESDGLVVLVVEDVHWADEATLDLLRFVGRRIRTAHALILVTYRDEGLAADDPLRVVVGQLSGQRSTRRIGLPRLSESAVSELVADSGFDARTLHQLTAGNPFYVTEVLRTPGRELPRSVRDAVLARSADLSDDAGRTLEIAALLGSRVDPTLLLEVSDLGPSEAGVVDELVEAGTLIADGSELRFRHEIARLAVEQAIPPQRTHQAHRRILDLLKKSGFADEARLAHHAEGCGDGAAVLDYAPAAGRRASELAAHREAEAQFGRAIRYADRADARTVAQLYDAWAHELALVDRWQDSADARERALARWREVGDRRGEGACLRRLSRTMWRLCRGDDAERAAVEALEALEPLGPGPELAWGYANLANHRMNRGEDEAAVAAARQAREVAEQFGVTDALSDALNTEACSSYSLGLVWSPLLRRSLEIAKAERLDEQAGRAYANMYSLYVGAHKLPESESVYVEGLAYCDEHDITTFSLCLRGERSHLLFERGQWDAAEALASSLLDRAGPSPVNRLNPLVTLGAVKARRGSADCWTPLDEAASLAQQLREPEWIGLVATTRAEAYWLAGRDDDARSELAAVREVAERSGVQMRSPIIGWWYRVTGSPLDVDVDVMEPWSLEIAGQPDEASDEWQRRGLAYDAAVALLASDDEAALREAFTRLDALGATAAAKKAQQVMRSRGVRSVPSGLRASTRSHPAGLTRREQDVLELLAENLTNEEIAARLFVSTKTVDHHVSSILAKLQVTSRRQAAAEASRLGLVPQPG